MASSRFSTSFFRHLSITLGLLSATIILAYLSFIYLRYFAREHGHPAGLIELARVWSLPSLFAVAFFASLFVTVCICQGVNLGPIRFLALAIVCFGFPIQHIISQAIAGG